MDALYQMTVKIDGVLIPGDTIQESLEDISLIRTEDVLVPNAGGEVIIDLASITAAQLKLLVVTSDQYDIGASELIYKLHATGETPADFSGPLIWTGATFGHVGVVPDKLLITNTLTSTADANIRVIMVYDPTA